MTNVCSMGVVETDAERFLDVTGIARSRSKGDDMPAKRCSSKLFVTRLLPAGWFSTLHGMVKPMMRALREGGALLPPLVLEFTDASSCPTRRLDCFFALDEPICKHNDSFVESLDLNSNKFIRSESPLMASDSIMPAPLRSRGWFRWTAQVLQALTTPSRKLDADVL